MIAKELNWNNLAVLFLNRLIFIKIIFNSYFRYLDIFEVIEDPETANLAENEEFNKTDIPSPYDVYFKYENIKIYLGNNTGAKFNFIKGKR